MKKLSEEWDEIINEFVLPEKWCIFAKKNSIVHKWFNDKLNRDISCEDEGNYFHYPEFQRGVCTSGEIKNSYTEITFEQFKKHVLKKEIIGYKCPTDLYNGCIKKGTIYEKQANGYFPKNDIVNHLPAEIVEAWEPVYKEKPEFKVGDWVYAGMTTPFEDYRSALHIPCFQIKQILIDGNGEKWASPSEGKSCGILFKYLRYATKEEILACLTKKAQEKDFVIGAKINVKVLSKDYGVYTIYGYNLTEDNNLCFYIDSECCKRFLMDYCTLYKEPSFNYDELSNTLVKPAGNYGKFRLEDKDYLKLQALEKLQRIANYVNEGWTPDWSDENQPKYYIYTAEKRNCLVDCAYQWNKSFVYFKSKEIAEKVIKDNPELMKQIFE